MQEIIKIFHFSIDRSFFGAYHNGCKKCIGKKVEKVMQPREGQVRIPSGCAISGMFSKEGKRMDGSSIIKSIATMHDRSNGLGGGFAGYGIYPEYKDYYAFHIFYDHKAAKLACEEFLEEHFDIINLSKIPTQKHPRITDEPLIWRYFVTPLHTKLKESQLDEKEFVVRSVIKVNTKIDGAYVFSSGKDMGVFKAVGYPEDVGEFYRLTADIAGRRMGAIRPIRPAGGAGRTRLPCWIRRLCTTARYPLTTPTAVISKCSDINVRFLRTRKSSPISSTSWCGGGGSPTRRRPALSRRPSGAPSAAWRKRKRPA